MPRQLNRKLLTSVFNAQEAREAVLGGARIIDSEDPKSALGNISPLHIMDVSDAVLDFARDLELQLSTNIGEDQLIYRRSDDGAALEKSPYEMAGKAAQAAIGVATAMGVRLHPCNIVKVGLDGMPIGLLHEVLGEVVRTLRRTESLSHCQVMSVLFAQDLELWNERKRSEAVRRELIGLREFSPANPEQRDAFDLCLFAAKTLRDRDGSFLFDGSAPVTLEALVEKQVLPKNTKSSHVRLSELFPHEQFFDVPTSPRTTRDVIRRMVDVTADAGANAMMLDTSILCKVANICLVRTESSAAKQLTNLSPFVLRDGVEQRGILDFDDIAFFVDYCHTRNISPNIAGSVESFQAQQLWTWVPKLSQISTRGAASGRAVDPATGQASEDTRQGRVIVRDLVRGLAPPEHAGVLNVPVSLQNTAHDQVLALYRSLRNERQRSGLPTLHAFYVEPTGAPHEIQL